MEVIIMPTAEKAVKPPLLVPVFRDRLLGELCDGQHIRSVNTVGHHGRCLKTPYYTHIYPPLYIIFIAILKS